MRPVNPCEFEGCEQPAVGYVEAQWTVVDFVRYESCETHFEPMLSGLRETYVEGRSCWPEATRYLSPLQRWQYRG